MRTPLLSRGKLRLQVSRQEAYPAPTGGLNARDSYANMSSSDAITLNNIFPNSSYCEVRYGSQNYVTGFTGTGKTLATYSTLSGSQEMYYVSASGVYDTGKTLKLARTDGKHQIVQMGDGTNNWLMLFNGVDKPAYYDGTTWTAVDAVSVPALTGVTTTTLIGGMSYKGRLILIEKDKLKFWYLAAGNVGGALTAFDLTQQGTRGGYLMACTNWTMDGGDGLDDRAVFMTSEGEVIVYSGTDPATAADWVKIGTYYIGKPLGRRCLCRFGGDVLVLTENGIVSLTAIVAGVINQSKIQISDKIRNLYASYARSYGSNYGWQGIIYEAENAFVVNVPVAEDGTHYQLVMNTITGSWCRFTDWDAENFVVFNKQLYYTRSTKIATAWDRSNANQTDEGASFNPEGVPAFTTLKTPTKKKVRGIFCSLNLGAITGSIFYDACVEYNPTPISSLSASYVAGTSTTERRLVCPVFPVANAVSFRVRLAGVGTQWTATEWLYETGGVL